MADLFEKVAPGQPLRGNVRAGAWNAMLDCASAYRRGLLGSPAPNRPGSSITPAVEILIRNDTGADLDAGAVLGIGEAVVDPEIVPDDVRRRPVFAGVTPVGVGVAFVILSEPLKGAVDGDDEPAPGKIGRAVVSGVAVTKVSGTGEFAGPTADESEFLTAADSGPCRVLQRVSGSGAQVAVVLIEGTSCCGATSPPPPLPPPPAGCSGSSVWKAVDGKWQIESYSCAEPCVPIAPAFCPPEGLDDCTRVTTGCGPSPGSLSCLDLTGYPTGGWGEGGGGTTICTGDCVYGYVDGVVTLLSSSASGSGCACPPADTVTVPPCGVGSEPAAVPPSPPPPPNTWCLQKACEEDGSGGQYTCVFGDTASYEAAGWTVTSGPHANDVICPCAPLECDKTYCVAKCIEGDLSKLCVGTGDLDTYVGSGWLVVSEFDAGEECTCDPVTACPENCPCTDGPTVVTLHLYGEDGEAMGTRTLTYGGGGNWSYYPPEGDPGDGWQWAFSCRPGPDIALQAVSIFGGTGNYVRETTDGKYYWFISDGSGPYAQAWADFTPCDP